MPSEIKYPLLLSSKIVIKAITWAERISLVQKGPGLDAVLVVKRSRESVYTDSYPENAVTHLSEAAKIILQEAEKL